MNIERSELQKLVSGTTSRFQIWSRFITAINAKSIAEIGVWKGEFARYLLGQCNLIERYYRIDPWQKLTHWNKPLNVDAQSFDYVYTEAMNNTAFAAQKVVVLRGKTKDTIDSIPDESLDFAYIDGDHTLRGITIDLIKLFPKLKENAFIGGDDFTNNPWQHHIRFEPTLVFPFSIYFAEAMDAAIAALPFNQYLIQKVRGSRFSFVDTTENYGDISLNRLFSKHVEGNSDT